MIGEAWLAKKGWEVSRPVRRWLVYGLIALAIGITAVVAYRGIRDGIRRAIDDSYKRGFAVGQSTAEAKCRNDYLDAVARANTLNAEATNDARAAIERLASNLNADRQTVEGYAREPRPNAADGCRPAGDPRVVRAAGKADAARAAAEARLRDLRSSAGATSAAPGRR